ncbi:methyltransferase domain-containing protein [Streptomyces sp. HU2014]|uniref:methyltransferase domain-containing protein n=1 Tax=Streptomyces sp. HU2014 TaxID=2939414 RepID=UPI00200F3ED4|nr:methyltransferase domain-containing protein [Streptomyces sp. HU2014]UQI45936.1 methyltransferase domain-containing protein [Streptomyces sp. HU2014]
MAPDLDELRAAFDREVERAQGWPEGAPWVRDAAVALPRHQFAPDRLWHWDGHTYLPVDRAEAPDRWAQLVYGGLHDAAVTQVIDGEATSSLSCETVVADMLDCLSPSAGHRVLELGTGTGRNAALLAHRAGPGRVVTVETDASLAETARQRLATAGAEVEVVVGDGAKGYPPGAPYERVISTYAVETIPGPWLEQTRPGGRIVAPWGHLGLIALDSDGTCARGRIQGLAQFMPARGLSGGPTNRFLQVRDGREPDDEQRADRDLAPLHQDWHLRFAIRVLLPDVYLTTKVDDDGTNVWLNDAASWAGLYAQGDGSILICQGGTRRLADELDRAWGWWAAHDEPDLYDWGMTVTPSDQWMWVGDEKNRVGSGATGAP